MAVEWALVALMLNMGAENSTTGAASRMTGYQPAVVGGFAKRELCENARAVLSKANVKVSGGAELPLVHMTVCVQTK